MGKLIDLATFRKKNRLTQQQVADFLGTSKAFISFVEKGSCRLPDEKIQMLVGKSEWNTDTLVPAFTRFLLCWDEYNKKSNIHKKYWPLEDENPFGLPINGEVIGLYYGNFGIDDAIANAILAKMPDINREWLLTGEGKMYDSPHSVDYENRIAALEESLEALKKTVAKLEKAVLSLHNS